MLKAIVIDDEQDALDVLQLQLKRFCSEEVMLIAVTNSGAEGIELILHHKPDLVFLDIEMPHVSGFDVLSATARLNYNIIFTTAYDQFAIRAFKYAAVDYLLKPIDINELVAAVKKAMKASESQKLEEKLNRLLKKVEGGSQKIAVPGEMGVQLIRPSDIIRCESDSNYTTIFMLNGKKIVTAKTLKDVEDSLAGFSFFRIHQSHLVNIEHVSKLIKGDGAQVIMSDNSQLPISRARKEVFFEMFRKI